MSTILPVRSDSLFSLGRNWILLLGTLALFTCAAPLPRLKAIDPGLLALVHETRAGESGVDWRHEPFRAESSQAEQRRERAPGRPDGRGVYRASVAPHWFADNTKFWYRNDLPGGAREFILVDAERGVRQHAFDHQAVARQMADGTDATRLPIESLRFSDDGQSVVLVGRNTNWTLDLKSGDLRETSLSASGFAEGLLPQSRPRPTSRTGPESEITFDNRLDREVAVFWLDTQGRRQSYGTIEPRGRKIQHTFSGHVWLVIDDRGDTLAVFEAANRPDVAVIDDSLPERRDGSSAPRERARPDSSDRSPDGRWTAVVREHNIFIYTDDSEEIQLTKDGHEGDSYGRISWSPDSSTLIAWRIAPGERKQVHLVRSSPEGGGRAQLESRAYALPGDEFPKFELSLVDVATHQHTKPDVDRFEHQWLTPRLRWNRDETRFSYLQVDRGHQRLRVIEVNPTTGDVRNIIDERSDTFIWTVHTENLRLDLVTWLDQTDEIIHVSERDGWRHLYLVDIPEASIRQITCGEWVVRGIERIDADTRQIWFSAGGRHPDQDPYFLHHYRVNFDGTGLVALTDGNGTHSIEFSPDRGYIIDTWSRVDAPPIIELRRTSDGTLVCGLEEADVSELVASGWTPPEPFVAKGRDGETDIYGLIHRPRDLDPTQQYPVIESIYAGPQGSFVPKSFSPATRFASLTELGFIVVQIDGMGTANRSKAFHDVCHQNLKDGGFPDRILWMQAAARQYPLHGPVARRHLWQLGRRTERRRRGPVPSRLLQGRRRFLWLPRQSPGQGLMERTMDGLPPARQTLGQQRRQLVFRLVEHRQRTPARRQPLPDRRRDGHERPARIHAAFRRCPHPRRQGFRSARHPQRRPRHGRPLRPTPDGGLLRPSPHSTVIPQSQLLDPAEKPRTPQSFVRVEAFLIFTLRWR
jgi:dipeptidyl-peptidase 4